MQPTTLKFTIQIFTIFSPPIQHSSRNIFAQNIIPPQYIDENGNFIVTCPGLPGTQKPPELLTSTIGILFNKPRIVQNPRVPESCYTNQYQECGDIGTAFSCDRNGVFDRFCNAGEMAYVDNCVKVPSGFFRRGGTETSVQLLCGAVDEGGK